MYNGETLVKIIPNFLIRSSSTWRQISNARISTFTNETPQKKHQKVGEGSSSSKQRLPHLLAYPLKKKDLTVITVVIFSGKLPSK